MVEEIHRDPATDRAAGLVASRTWIPPKNSKITACSDVSLWLLQRRKSRRLTFTPELVRPRRCSNRFVRAECPACPGDRPRPEAAARALFDDLSLALERGLASCNKENSCLKWAASFLQKVVEVPVTGLDAREIPRDPATDRAAGPVGSRMVTSP